MRKKLSAIGGSLGFVIEKPILELLSIDRDTEFEMTTDGEGLHLRPIRTEDRKAKLKNLLTEGDKRYGKMLKNLA